MARGPEFTRNCAIAVVAGVLVWASPPAAALTPEDDADLGRVESYLNSIETLQGRFLQVAEDGAQAHGRFFLKRPRRLRFEYAPPTPVLIVGDGIWLVFHDKEIGQVNRLPLSSTPVGLLVEDVTSFTGRVAVTAVERRPGQLRVTIRDRDNPGQGELRLVFSDPPLELRQWHVIDAQGLTTRVSLFEVLANAPLEAGLFVFRDPPTPDQRAD